MGTGLACGSAGSGLGGRAGGERLAGLRGSSGFTGGLPAAGQRSRPQAGLALVRIQSVFKEWTGVDSGVKSAHAIAKSLPHGSEG